MKKKAKVAQVKATSKVLLAALMEREFQMALATVMNGELPIKTSYELLKTFDVVVEHQTRFEAMRQRILEKHGQKDAEGKLQMNEGKTEYLLADKPAFDKEYSELCSIEVEVPKVSMSYLEGVKISPPMLRVLLRTIVTP